jgi:hypothetical protein
LTVCWEGSISGVGVEELYAVKEDVLTNNVKLSGLERILFQSRASPL